MTRIVYVNGDYMPEGDAKIFDFSHRGFLDGRDGVYEVTTVIDGKLIDFGWAFTRLERSVGRIGYRETQWTATPCVWKCIANWSRKMRSIRA